MIPFITTTLVILLGIYYLTIFITLMGNSVLGKIEIKFGLALIPFYYWITKEKEAIKTPIVEKVSPVIDEPVKKVRKPRQKKTDTVTKKNK